MTRSDSISLAAWPPQFDRGVVPAIALVIAFSVWVFVSNSVLTAAFGPEPARLSESLLGMVSSTIQLGIALAILRYEGVRLRDLGLSPRLLVPALVGAVGVLVAVNAYVAGALAAGGNELSFAFFAIFQSPPFDMSRTTIVVTAVYFFVFVGPAEELAFRGYLQNKLIALSSGVGDRLARGIGVVGAAVTFSLLHVPTILLTSDAGLGGAVGSLVLISLSGITFGVVYEFTRNLYLVAILHGFGDFWPVFVDPGPVAWPNYLVLVLLYAVVVLAYRQWATRTERSTPLGVSAD